MESFRSSLIGRSDATKTTYSSVLKHYSSWLNERGLKLKDASAEEVEAFLSHGEKEHGWSLATLKLYSRVLSRLYSYMGADAERVRRIAREVPEPEEQMFVYIRADDMARFLKATTSERNYIMLRFMLATGVRCDELLTLTPANVDFGNRTAVVYGKGKKGKKPRTIFFDEETGRLLKQYVESRGITRNARIFSITPQALRYIVKKTAKRAKLENWVDVSPHILRHSFAIKFLEDRKDDIRSLEVLRRILGHRDLKTTMRYLDFLPSVTKEIYDTKGFSFTSS